MWTCWSHTNYSSSQNSHSNRTVAKRQNSYNYHETTDISENEEVFSGK